MDKRSYKISIVKIWSVAEWSIAHDCKSCALRLRRFESYPAHKTKNWRMPVFCFAGKDSDARGLGSGSSTPLKKARFICEAGISIMVLVNGICVDFRNHS